MPEIELLTVSIGLGLAASLLYGELFGLAAGGMVVPGYMALYANKPIDVGLTLLAALLTFGILKGLSQIAIVKTVGGVAFPGHPLAATKEELLEMETYSPYPDKARELGGPRRATQARREGRPARSMARRAPSAASGLLPAGPLHRSC